MSLLEAVLLGIIQGFTEFLPVSSSGHLVLFQKIFHIQENQLTFDIVLHLGTLLPILWIYRETILDLIRNPFQKLSFLLSAATLPAVLVALLFKDQIEAIFESGQYLALAFLLTGILLLLADRIQHGTKTMTRISFLDAFVIGLMQAIAIAPGVSRSGSTIFGSLSCKLKRETAAQFSFLIAMPAIAGATTLTILDIVKEPTMLQSLPWMPMVFGFVAAALSGYLAMQWMLQLIQKASLKYFSYYVFALALFVLFDQTLFHMFF